MAVSISPAYGHPQAVDYKVYFGDAETPSQLDRLAQTLYLGQHDFGIEGGCNTEARDLICANIFRQYHPNPSFHRSLTL